MNKENNITDDPFVRVFNDRFDDYINAAKNILPHDYNRVSDLYDAFRCLRMYLYKRLFWKKAGLPEDGLIKIFMRGNEMEDLVTAVVQSELKFRYYRWNPGNKLSDEKHRYRGTPDGWLQIKIADDNIPKKGIDIKSVSGNIFPTITDENGLIESKHWWHQSYYYQAMGYMGLSGEKEWYLLFDDKQKLDFNLVKITFNPDVYQSILDKCKEINKWVENYNAIEGELLDAIRNLKEQDRVEEVHDLLNKSLNNLTETHFPKRITYDPDICNRCDFFDQCQPKEYFLTAGILSQEIDPAIIKEFEQRSKLREDYQEYTKLQKKHKEMYSGIENVLIGDRFHISSKKRKDGAFVMTIMDEDKGGKI